jgi:hypothetical protein
MNTTKTTKILPYTLFIDVTARDIAAGKQNDCGACPIARAANRALRKAGLLNNSARVGYSLLTIHTRRARREVGDYLTTAAAMSFVSKFDSDRSGQPFSFVATRRFIGEAL